MSHHLNRRTALIAAGQGKTVLLLAACGKAVAQSETSTSAVSSARSTSALAAATTRAQVTVPGLNSASSSAVSSATTKKLIPLTPVTHATTPVTTTTIPTTTTTVHTTKSSAPSTTTTTPTTPTTSSSTTTSTTSSSKSSTSTSSSSSQSLSGPGLAGKVVAIDPGHNGANGDHPEIINQLIDGGYGQRNVCNTTGTETNAGYTEHEFTWHVATYLKPLLEAKGIKVIMTRSNDTSVGPCTDKRAAMENNADSDAVVSIHGDGAPAEVRGFYVLTATRPPAGSTIAAASLRLASAIADAAIAAGFPPSNTLGSGGLWKRDDLTGLNRSTRPKILIECGNMRNATEAALMSSTSGQKRYAAALAQGVFAFLQG